jgi:hypothetical protein
MHTPPEHSSISDGYSLSLGGLYWPRPYFPSRTERAVLIGQSLPHWAIPSGNTAGWIWTGMGLPTPLTVLRPNTPALSPLEREHWGAREVRNSRHTVVDVAGQSILDPLSTEIELLSHGRDIDSAATQILFLRSLREQVGQPIATRMSQSQREHAHAVLQRVRVLTERYPDITRYTS